MDPDFPASSALPPHLRPALGAARLRARWGGDGLVRALGVREPMPRGLVRRAGTGDLFLAAFHQAAEARLAEGMGAVPAGSLVAWAEGEAQAYGRADAAWIHSWLHLRGAAAMALAAHAGLATRVAIALPSTDWFEARLVELHAEQARPTPDAVAIEMIVALLLRQLARAAPPGDAIARARRAIVEQPMARRRLADLAARAGCAPEHLCRAFRARYGVAPLAFASRLRLERAARLLRAGLGTAEASARCGWADPRQFARVFRARYGATPAAWRGRAR